MIGKRPLLIVYAIIVIGAVTMMLMLQRHGAPLEHDGHHKIGALELAPTAEKAKTIIDDWGDALRGVALEDIRFDYGFIALYTAALALTGFLGPMAWGSLLRGRLARAGRILGWAMFVAGVMDVIENLGMTAEISGNYGLAPVVFTVSSIKWFIIIVTLVYALPTIPMIVFRMTTARLVVAESL
jgi:hypothetical protein